MPFTCHSRTKIASQSALCLYNKSTLPSSQKRVDYFQSLSRKARLISPIGEKPRAIATTLEVTVTVSKANVFKWMLLNYYDLKIELFHSYLQHHGTNQTMGRNSSNFQILLDCLVMNGIKNIITSHWPVVLYKSPYVFGTFKLIRPVAPNLEFRLQTGFLYAVMFSWVFL